MNEPHGFCGALAGFNNPESKTNSAPSLTDKAGNTEADAADEKDNLLCLHYFESNYRGVPFRVDSGCLAEEVAAARLVMDDIDRRYAIAPWPDVTPVLPPTKQASRKVFESVAKDYITSYEEDRRHEGVLTASTFDKETRAVKFWSYYFANRPIVEIGIEECKTAVKHCRNYPLNVDSSQAASMCRYPHDRRTPKSSTTKARLQTLKNIFSYAYRHGVIESDPTQIIDTRQRKSAGEEKIKSSFTLAELLEIFPGSSYGDDFFTKISRDKAYDAAKFWLPLIALLSGARSGEIIQLELADIKEDENGIAYFHMITDPNDGESKKRLKTASSRRRVPIHSKLIEIGFLSYVEERRHHPSKPRNLFDRYTTGAKANASEITQWFKGCKNGVGRDGAPRYRKGYLERRGLKTNPETRADKTSISFHSFRHTFTDAARKQQFPNGDWIRDIDTACVLGHGSNQTTRDYGNTQDMRFLKLIIESVDYIGVDFAAIDWYKFKGKWGIQAVN